MERHLFLIRSAFQAYLCLKIIDLEGISNFDVIYVSRSRNRKDEHYFSKLASFADRAAFFKHFTTDSRLSGYLKAVTKFPIWLFTRKYSHVHVASFSLWYFRVICAWWGKQLCTYDDGSVNYSRKAQRLYELSSLRDRAFGTLFGGIPIMHFAERSVVHHAIRTDMENIVPSRRIKPVCIGEGASGAGAPQTIAIGQNFHEYLEAHHIERMMSYIRSIDAIYFPHPREDALPADMNVEQVDVVLEDFVEERLKQGPITLIGGFSTAFITIHGVRKIYLDVDRDEHRRRLMEQVGCEVIEL